jgi:transcriptional regulator with XRE-family HTH domain
MGRRPISLAFSGERLAELRERRGWTQEDVARQCTAAGGSVSRSQVGRWESGENKPGARMLPVLAAAFKVELDEFLASKQPAAK